MYRLDRSRMVWNMVERFDDQVVFVDNWNAIMVPTPSDTWGKNKIYMHKLGEATKPGKQTTRAPSMISSSVNIIPYGLTCG